MPASTTPVKDDSKVERTPPTVGKTMTAEQEMEHDRSVFQKLTASDSATSSPPPVKAEPKSTPAPDPDLPVSDEPPPPKDGAARRELETIAKSVLGRDGLTGAALNAILQLPDEEIKATVDRSRKSQSNRSKAENRLKEIEDRLAKMTPVQADPTDELADYLKTQFGDEKAAELVKKVMGAKKPESRAEVEPGAQPQNAAEAAEHYRDTLDNLAEKYPGLKEPGAEVKVVERADRLMRAEAVEGTFTTHKALVDAALKLACSTTWEPDPQQAQRELAERRRYEANGQPMKPSNGLSTPKTYTQDEIDRHALKLLNDGKSADEVNRVVRKMELKR